MGDRPPQESPKHRYNWGSDHPGSAQIADRCVAEVDAGRMFRSWQCTRKRGHGYGGLYCKQHAKQYPEAK